MKPTLKTFFALTPLFLAIAFLMTSCTSFKPGCIISDKLAGVAANVITSKLQCANPQAVKADMDELVKGFGLCKTGPIADVVCPLLVDSVVNKVVNGVIPAAWACSATDAKALVRDALTLACKQIPVSEWKPDSE